jgi:hypothetical protein
VRGRALTRRASRQTSRYLPGSGAGGQEELLQAGKLHLVRAQIHHFLEHAPARIQIPTGHGRRTQLLDAACPNPP